MRIAILLSAALAFAAAAPVPKRKPAKKKEEPKMETPRPVQRTEDEWRKALTPEQFKILRKKGTERAFTGAYHDKKDKGVYVCAGCGTPLFRSSEKFDSGTGWPSFWAPAAKGAVKLAEDDSFFSKRVEVLCAACGGHQGHVFDDGPPPTGQRYCINSAALRFVPGP